MRTARAIFDRVDAQDLRGLVSYLAEDAIMIFGNAEPLVGRQAIVAGVEAMLAALKAVRHHIRNEWNVGSTTIVECEISYTRLDDKEVTIPGVSIWHTQDGLITDYRVFYDPAPVFAG